MASALLTCIAPSWAEEVPARMLLLDGAFVGRDVIVVGERGAILRSMDNARTWHQAVNPMRVTLTGITFAGSNAQHLGWAVGHDALILATSDGGKTWAKQYQGDNLEDSFLDVLALDAQRVIAIGAYGLWVETNDAGRTWTRRKITNDDYHLNRITRGPPGSLYLAGEHGTLLRSLDAGASWTALARPYEGSFYGIVPVDQNALLAYGLRGHVYRSTDEGQSWQPVATPVPALLATAIRLKDNDVVFAGQARALLVSRDSGKTLEPAPQPIVSAIAELIELSDGNLLALGESGAMVLPKP